MIISQSIKSGVCNYSRAGRYFQVISAGGIVAVRLFKKGSMVFESDMWVGMNLDKPLEFDAIEITGEDGPIQFWAGDVSMLHLSIGNPAARAVRSSRVYLTGGAVQLTGPDLTRMALWVRPVTKSILLGGAQVDGTGWRAPAGQVTELPLLGTLFGYAEPASIDLANSNYLESVAGYLNAVAAQTQLNYTVTNSAGDYTLYPTQFNLAENRGGVTANHPQFDGISGTWTPIRHIDGRVILVRSTGSIIEIYESVNDGRYFTALFSEQDIKARVGDTSWDLSSMAITLVGNILSFSTRERLFWFDLSDNTFGHWRWVSDTRIPDSGMRYGFWLDDAKQCLYMQVGSGTTGKDSVWVTTDAGSSWSRRINADCYAGTYAVSPDGRYLAVKRGTKIAISDDRGLTWYTSTHTHDANVRARYIGEGVFGYILDGHLKTFTLNSAHAVEYFQINGPGGTSEYSNGSLHVLPGGLIVTGGTSTGTILKFQLAITGTLDAAPVEIMELLK